MGSSSPCPAPPDSIDFKRTGFAHIGKFLRLFPHVGQKVDEILGHAYKRHRDFERGLLIAAIYELFEPSLTTPAEVAAHQTFLLTPDGIRAICNCRPETFV